MNLSAPRPTRVPELGSPIRPAALSALLLAACVAMTQETEAQVALAIDGYGPSGWSTAASGQTLSGTRQGKIRLINGDTGSWTMLAVGISLQTYSVNDPEYSTYSQLITTYPWLASSPTTVGATLGSSTHADSIVGLVNSTDLAAAQNTPLLVRAADLASQLSACIVPTNHDPDAVRDFGQAFLLGQTARTWTARYSAWPSSSGMEGYWFPTYARPISGPEDYTNVHWFRLMESACTVIAGYQQTIAFTRSADVVTAASLGLNLHVQAVTAEGNPPLTPTSDPETTPGLENVNPANLPRFKVTFPITIAIPYTAPFLPGQYVPYEPGVVNIDALPGTVMLAAIGVTTSATHAVFAVGSSQVATPLFRFFAGGSLATFVVPNNATDGWVEFEDMVGEDESAAMPIKGFSYVVPDETDPGDSDISDNGGNGGGKK